MSSHQSTAALRLLSSFANMDLDTNLSLRSPTCTHQMLPTSLGFPLESNADFEAHFKSVQELIAEFPVTAKEVIENGNQVTIWATSTAKFKEDVTDGNDEEWSFEGEYMFVFFFDEDGRIERILEFMDSGKVLEMGKLMERARRNLMASKAL